MTYKWDNSKSVFALNWIPRHKDAGMNGCIAPGILNMALYGDEWLASYNGRFTPTCWIEW